MICLAGEALGMQGLRIYLSEAELRACLVSHSEKFVNVSKTQAEQWLRLG